MKTEIVLLLMLLICSTCFGVAITSDPWLGEGWDVNAPNNEALSGNSYKELQDLRKGIGIRMTKEHIAFAASSVGGEHRPGGSSILYYGATPAIDGNVAAGVFVHDGLIYDTTLEEFFTADAAETAKVPLRIGTAGIADGNVMTADIADGNVTFVKLAPNTVVSIDTNQTITGTKTFGAPPTWTYGVMKNNVWLQGENVATTSQVNLMKVLTDNSVIIPDGVKTETDAAPAVDSGIANKKYVDDVNKAIPTTYFNYSGTQVFSSTCSTANTYQDLNLSAVVGANRALVYLEVKSSGINSVVAFRPNGNTTNISYSLLDNMVNPAGASCGGVYTANYAVNIVTVTDSSGIVEWTCGNTSTTITITVVGYVK